jgi:hypothetical protein
MSLADCAAHPANMIRIYDVNMKAIWQIHSISSFLRPQSHMVISCELTIRRLIVHKHPQPSLLHSPFLPRHLPALIPDRTEQPQMGAAQVPETAQLRGAGEGHEVQRGNGREVPFHIGNQDEARAGVRVVVQDFVGFGGAGENIFDPVEDGRTLLRMQIVYQRQVEIYH